MNPFLAVIKKELTSVLRDSTIIISILIQLFIASFSSAMLLGMLSLYDADTIMKSGGVSIKIGMIGASDNPLQSYLLEREIQVAPYATLTEAETALYQGKVNAILVVPQETRGGADIKLYLPNSDTASTLVRMVIQEPLKQYENYLRAQAGIEVRYTDLKGKPTTSFEFVYSVLLPMLMFFPAFVAGSMVIDSLTEEVENDTLQTLLSAPLTINGIISAKIVAAIILAVLQCIAWLTLLRLNGIAIQNLIWILLLAVTVAGITSTAAGLAAALLRDRERSQFIYSLVLLAAVAVSTLLDLSPLKTLSRLAIGDYYTSGWNIAVFVIFLVAQWLLLLRISRRLVV
jgi:ABC-2 type transport system permease protein